MTNLAKDKRLADTKKQLAGRLLSELKKTGDPRVTGDGGTFDRAPYISKQQMRRRGNRKKAGKKKG